MGLLLALLPACAAGEAADATHRSHVDKDASGPEAGATIDVDPFAGVSTPGVVDVDAGPPRAGSSVDTCEDDATRCDGATLEVCVRGAWSFALCETGSSCHDIEGEAMCGWDCGDGLCEEHEPAACPRDCGTCRHEETRCRGFDLEVCLSGVWNVALCESGTACGEVDGHAMCVGT